MSLLKGFKVLSGDETGLLKLVSVEKAKVIARRGVQARKHGLEHLCFAPDGAVAVGKRSGESSEVLRLRGWSARTKDGDLGDVAASELAGSLRGLAVVGQAASPQLLTCSDAGKVRVCGWSGGGGVVREFEVRGPVSAMAAAPGGGAHFAVGGKESDLAVWDLETQQPLFQARNVPHDFLDMRVPVWVSSLAFVPNLPSLAKGGNASKPGHCLVTGTGLSQVRLYDTRAQRRPVGSVELDGTRVMSLAVAHDGGSVIAADAAGKVQRIDLRAGLRLAGTYKGFGGSVRCLSMHPTLPLFASGGLDRTVRVHHVETREMLCKVYVKQKVNCVLFAPDGELESRRRPRGKRSSSEAHASGEGGGDEEEEEEEDESDPWKELEEIEEQEEQTKMKKRKKKMKKCD